MEEQQSRRIGQSAWAIWIGITIVMCVLILRGDKHAVTPEYRSASLHWFAGEPLYNMRGAGFIYFPQTALVFAPWGLLPVTIGEILWRCTIVGVFAGGVARLTRLLSRDDRWFLTNSIVSAITALGCVRNGQATLIIAGLMMLACADISQRCWTRATFLLVLAFAFKPTSLILILLVGAIFPPMLWRLAIGMLIVALAPFLTQHPQYVWSQFRDCYLSSRVAFSIGETGHWAQLFGIFKVAGVDVPHPVQTASRVIAGLATLFICWLAVRKLPPNLGVFYLYGISTCYLMLFNSRTEGSTYAMVAPVYGLLLASALQRRDGLASTWLIIAITATVLNYELIHLFTRQRDAEVWVCPFVCVLVTIYLVYRLIRDMKPSEAVSVPATASP